jgi:predicted GNAT family acetyltransferase
MGIAGVAVRPAAAARIYGRLGFTEAPGFDVYVDL